MADWIKGGEANPSVLGREAGPAQNIGRAVWAPGVRPGASRDHSASTLVSCTRAAAWRSGGGTQWAISLLSSSTSMMSFQTSTDPHLSPNFTSLDGFPPNCLLRLPNAMMPTLTTIGPSPLLVLRATSMQIHFSPCRFAGPASLADMVAPA